MKQIFTFVAGAVLALGLAIFLIGSSTVVDVTDIKAVDGGVGAPQVSGTFRNSGAAVDIAYWVEKDRTGARHCAGQVRLGAGENKPFSFTCRALAGHQGQFTIQTAAAD